MAGFKPEGFNGTEEGQENKKLKLLENKSQMKTPFNFLPLNPQPIYIHIHLSPSLKWGKSFSLLNVNLSTYEDKGGHEFLNTGSNKIIHFE